MGNCYQVVLCKYLNLFVETNFFDNMLTFWHEYAAFVICLQNLILR